ncbi:hypothetical protein PCURB6_27030 [Paenibacillus curdlanolyticus]|nr:hypothetical protein PCURB6_27030 [Paenibacillus curdlanolyticus]
MKVSTLIEILSDLEDKDIPVGYMIGNEFVPLDDIIGVNKYADCIILQHEIRIHLK